HLDELRAELDAAAAVAASRPERAHYQLVWRPRGLESTAPSPVEYAFLVKRASVVVTGEDPEARVASGPLPADAEWLRAFYGEEVEAYLDLVAFAPGPADASAAALAALTELDPGKPVALDGAAWPETPAHTLAEAAAAAERGFALTLFAAPPTLDAAALAPLKILANEFRGEIAFDPTTRPSGAARAWSFVRGEDLALRVVVEPEAGADRLTLLFPDPQLRAPVWVPLDGGETIPLAGTRLTAAGLEVRVADPGPAVALRLERASIEELEGVEEEVTIADERRIPVEEILRRLQAFEDAQTRRVRHWQAVNTTTLRFQAASGVQAVEATFEGEVFYRAGQPFDWAWQRFYLNGVAWRGKSIPEIPLVQPEKAAAMPLEVHFTKEYTYSLRGTEPIDGRDCWVVEFEPNVAVEGRTLFRGTVWVDRETSARVRTRALQLGLQGEVISNEETLHYTPITADGRPAPWGAEAFVLPLRTVGQQLLSIVNTATVVEREVLLTAVSVNGSEFDSRREAVLASEATMVRDTEKGLRYLVPEEGAAPGERVVKEGYDTNKLFLLGGVFYDESLDFPLPLAGINYFDLNFRGGERQLNAFFGGVLGIVNYADPRFLGSKVDLGADVFAIAVASSDQLFRDGEEVPGEEVEELPARVTLNFGFPLGPFVKINSSYRLAYSKYGRTDDTAPEFVLPSDNFRHSIEAGVQFARSGYRLNLRGAYHRRSEWEPWGLPGNPEFDPDAQEYTTWEASAAKNWYLPGFRKAGLELDYLSGSNLDRFSKYGFGFFGGSRVHGYQIGKVRAEEAFAVHATYGFELGKVVRLDGIADAAWATDEVAGLDNELLAGAGIAGTFMGPWQTIVQVDLGAAVAGPDDGIVAYIVFLKLFD
ncbi:MAG TPA: hypothetical protein VI942_12950, partial [Thermoanaerobaculia bacterium]|nr:hypothetical protein [Thermoanaerobaculia bacterium]